MSWLLRSPFHGLISGSILLITYIGRRSGKEYSTPLNYIRDDNNLWVTSVRTRTWWRNFREEWPIRVIVQGMEIQGRGEAIVEQDALSDALKEFFRLSPSSARFFKVKLDEDGAPDPGDLERIVAERVLVKIKT
jgi:hypothetical protein